MAKARVFSLTSPVTRLCVAGGVSLFGEACRQTALPLLALGVGASAVQLTSITASAATATLFTNLFVGRLADRWDRRLMMVLGDVGCAVVVGATALLWLYWRHDVRLLYACASGVCLLASLSVLSYYTVIPELVGTEDLTRVNSVTEGIYALASILGPVMVGFLARTRNPLFALGVDSVSFLVPAAVCLTLPRLKRADDKARPGSVFEGVRFVWAQPALRSLTILLAIEGFFTGSLVDMVIVRANAVHASVSFVVGLILGARVLGASTSIVVAPWARRRFGDFGTFVATWVLIAGGTLLASETDEVGLVCFAIGAIGCAQLGSGVVSLSIRQEVTPHELMGQVTAAFWTMIGVTVPVGAIVTGMCATWWDVPVVLRLIGVGVAAVCALSFATPLARRRAGPQPE